LHTPKRVYHAASSEVSPKSGLCDIKFRGVFPEAVKVQPQN
jgi:hypothetical protein